MATRHNTQQRKDNLRRALLEACGNGKLLPGMALPPVRALANEYALSTPTVSQVIRELVDEGVLYTRSTAGTFVGRSQEGQGNLFLLVLSHPARYSPYLMSVCNGFEERIAHVGGGSLILDAPTARRWIADGIMPACSGVFDFDVVRREPILADEAIARVEFADAQPGGPHTDNVAFDNVDGGRQAASHLLRLGHRNIAFLGLHRLGERDTILQWSAEREAGWCQVMEQAGCAMRNLAFHPTRIPPVNREGDHNQQMESALEAARALVAGAEVTAIVVANAIATAALLETLKESGMPRDRWPALVSFDDASYGDGNMVSALRLPWEEVGREAANLLWERSRSALDAPAQKRLVPMRLIPRLSCRDEWAVSGAAAMQHSFSYEAAALAA